MMLKRTRMEAVGLLVLTLLGLPAFGLSQVMAQQRGRLPLFSILDVSPPTVIIAQPTTVTIAAALREGVEPPSWVILEQVDAEGKVIGALGRLRDDGQNADAEAGDGICTGRVSLNASVLGALRVQVAVRRKGEFQPASDAFVIDAIRDPQRRGS
jgi:hypothetical protein